MKAPNFGRTLHCFCDAIKHFVEDLSAVLVVVGPIIRPLLHGNGTHLHTNVTAVLSSKNEYVTDSSRIITTYCYTHIRAKVCVFATYSLFFSKNIS